MATIPKDNLVKSKIDELVDSYLKNQNVLEMLAQCPVPRKMMDWGYRLAVGAKELTPIEKAPEEVKRDLWDEACKYPLNREERVELARGYYFLLWKVEKMQ